MERKINIVVSESDGETGRLLSSLINQWAKNKGLESCVALHSYQSNEDLLDQWENGLQIDMIVIQEGAADEICGYDLAHRLITDNYEIPIVIILRNAFPGFERYRGDPLRFIVCPPRKETVFRCMDSCWKQMKRNSTSGHMLIVREGRRVLRLPVSSVIFFEHCNRYTNIFIAGKPEPFMINYSLKACKSFLPADCFIQCHRSYIINKSYVTEYSGTEITLLPNYIIPVGRTYKETIETEFHAWSLNPVDGVFRT